MLMKAAALRETIIKPHCNTEGCRRRSVSGASCVLFIQ